MNNSFSELAEYTLKLDTNTTFASADTKQLYSACAKAANALCRERLERNENTKRACYFSAEFLIGRLIYSNLYNLGVLDEAESFLNTKQRSLSEFEDIEDAALGNGGLGRLAACFLDSAATLEIPLDGYGIRYKYGLFKQEIDNGEQKELADDWLKDGDPFAVRNEKEAVTVEFADMSVKAVPYDYFVIGKNARFMNRLRLYQAESEEAFDFEKFKADKLCEAYSKKLEAQAVSAVLYPDDSDDEGKKLRIRQQYFFCSAALQNIISDIEKHGGDICNFSSYNVIQLNDTHPTVAIPELIRLLIKKGKSFDEAFAAAQRSFAYTNHTVMSEALEKWDAELYKSILPEIYKIIEKIDSLLSQELLQRGADKKKAASMSIIEDGLIHMARLAVFVSFSVNGVAKIHTGILKNDVLSNWYSFYPQRFSNKTNGITQRRWLALSNPLLTDYIGSLIGDDFIDNIDKLENLKAFCSDEAVLSKLSEIKLENKKRLSEYILKQENVELNPQSVFFVQVKRIHEYKRQLMNAFSIADIYMMLKSGVITDMKPVTFIIGGKAAASYRLAKAVIKYINVLADVINADPEVNKIMKVIFVRNYNVSYAEKIIPAADVSEQISLAGTEASGTGNMKFMLNGAVTLGTFDGANIEIVEQAGEDNNYIFGLTEQQVREIRDSYDPKELYSSDTRIKRVVDTLIDPEFSDDADGDFKLLYNSLLKSNEWSEADRYFVLKDLPSYTEARLRALRDYADKMSFSEKSLMNIASAGIFSSDRTVSQYAKQIWFAENN